jgi:diguanylate cyclase (GGDEF)-like protein
VEGGDVLRRLADELRQAALQLADRVVEECVATGVEPLGSTDDMERLGVLPLFVHEFASRIAEGEPVQSEVAGRLPSLARDHTRRREQLELGPRDIVTELLVLRRALWHFVTGGSVALTTEQLLVVESRLNGVVDEVIAESVAAYFQHATAELARRAREDALTGLLNHQAFSEALDAELERARRYGHRLALLVLDADRFKEINDTYGHREGDAVLRRVATVLRETARRSDLTGRVGGDEFAVALVQSDGAAARSYVVRLRAALRGGELPTGFTVSPGWAVFPDEAGDADALFRLADARSYERKRAGNPPQGGP